MKTILLFGAGKSATVLIDFLLAEAPLNHWKILVVDADLQLARVKVGSSPSAQALSFDIREPEERGRYIRQSDLVISLLPPALHIEVARDCVKYHKHLLTASYLDAAMRELEPEINKNKLLFICEMGLDPGIDHMSAMKLIHEIREQGGKLVSFKSHCGGLVAPESDDNPWHYKISWNPRNVVNAGKAGAVYRQEGKEVHTGYTDLFTEEHLTEIPEIGPLAWYPNRDSLSYLPVYGLESIPTFIRTTLRHPDFMYGWKNIIELKLTDENLRYQTDGKSLYDVFREHMDQNGFGQWLQQKLDEKFAETRSLMENLLQLMEAENEARAGGEEVPEAFMTADETGNLNEIGVDDVKNKAAAFIAHKMHLANLTLKQLFFLGLDDKETKMDQGEISAADVLLFALERKLALRPYDKDMVVMLHELEYEFDKRRSLIRSSLVVKGENHLRTAMAKTVGMPLGIAAKLILDGTIKLTGLHIPVHPEIYTPVLDQLSSYGIRFQDELRAL